MVKGRKEAGKQKAKDLNYGMQRQVDKETALVGVEDMVGWFRVKSKGAEAGMTVVTSQKRNSLLSSHPGGKNTNGGQVRKRK